MLYVMAERWPVATQYRDAFERIRISVFDPICTGSHPPRIGPVEPETRSVLESLDQIFSNSPVIGLNHMMSNITGQHITGAHLPEASTREADWNLNVDNLGGKVAELVSGYSTYDDVGHRWHVSGANNKSPDYYSDWNSNRVYPFTEINEFLQ